MTRAECIAELRLRQANCQRTAERHPCELARARSSERAQTYGDIIFSLGYARSVDSTVEALHRIQKQTPLFPPLARRVPSLAEATRSTIENALELIAGTREHA